MAGRRMPQPAGALILTKTLEELEECDWGEPDYPSYLVQTCHRLRRRRLQDFTTEDLRIMIGQGIGLEYLVPLAIQDLERNPLAEGDFYPGDLLHNVLSVPVDFWQARPDLKRTMEQVIDRAISLLDVYEPTDAANLRAMDRFLTHVI